MEYVAERKVDELGRILIPKEVRAAVGIDTGTRMKIVVTGGDIILRKSAPTCRICGAEMAEDDDFVICANCIRDIKAM